MDTADLIVMTVLFVIFTGMVMTAYRVLRGDWYDPEPPPRGSSREKSAVDA